MEFLNPGNPLLSHAEAWPAKRLKLDAFNSVPAQQEQLEYSAGRDVGAPSGAPFFTHQLEEAQAQAHAQPMLDEQAAEEQALLQLHARAAAEQAMMQQRHHGGSQLYSLPYLAQYHRQELDRPPIGLIAEYEAPSPAPGHAHNGDWQEAAAVMAAAPAADVGADGAEETDYTCHVCRKVFKREMNLVFHMTTHRPKQPQEEAAGGEDGEAISCQDCGKIFGTKYQAKKHYLRRHFQGERPFPCNKCGKRFVVREDLTMHTKSCGNVYTCGSCNVRLCSLGALKRHCKHFNHTALSHQQLHDKMSAEAAAAVAYYPQMQNSQLTAAAGGMMGLVPGRTSIPAQGVLSPPSSTEAAAHLLASQMVAQANNGGHPTGIPHHSGHPAGIPHAASAHAHPGMIILSAASNGLPQGEEAPATAGHCAPLVVVASQAPGAAEGGARWLGRMSRGEGGNAACMAAQALVSSSGRPA